MMDNERLRYSCQMSLPGFGEAGQELLKNSKVLVIGAGGLGCPAAIYLAAAGVGTLGIADDDVVSVSNLHRQILFNNADTGRKKVAVAASRLSMQNPEIEIVAHDIRVTSFNIKNVIESYDIVLDCTDNFETRYLVNDACVLAGKPLVYGAIYQYEGQVAVWNIINEDGSRSPNYRDLFPDVDAAQVPNCADGGVLPTVAGIIGSMQANEAIKYLTKTGELLAGKILLFDAFNLQSRTIKIGTVTQANVRELQKTISIPELTVDEVLLGLADSRFELVDIRTDEEHDQYNIGGTHIENTDLKNNLGYLQNGRAKVLYCSSGKRSREGVRQLKELLPNITFYSLKGGLKAWMESMPLDTHQG